MIEELSKHLSCGHCNNISRMQIIGSVKDEIDEFDESFGYSGDCANIYLVLECPACRKNNVIYYYWHDKLKSDDELTYETLYPKDSSLPVGLPSNILNTLKAAEKIKHIDVNSYATLLGRLLELVCLDKKAKGKTLSEMLKDLANNNEIPTKLVDVANGLRNFRNIGAHAELGELGTAEVPILKALCYAILEYIYSAPHLVSVAENKLKAIKMKKIK